MPKILVADLFGTLIPDDIEYTNYLYGNIDKWKTNNKIYEILNDKSYSEYLIEKLCLQCANDLKKFLNDGNELIIVSDLAAHEINLPFLYEKFIKKLTNYCNKTFKFYIVVKGGAGDFDKKDLQSYITENYMENGINYIIYKGYKFGLLDKKEDVFKGAQCEFNLDEYELYSIGNDYKDIPMLVKCIELGGKSSLLEYELYSNKKFSETTLDEAINYRLSIERYIFLERKMLKQEPNYSQLDVYERLKIKMKYIHFEGEISTSERIEWYKKRKEELYQEVRKGNITLEQLIKEKLIFDLCQTSINNCLEKKTFAENNLDKIDMYSIFRDYCNKVLNCDFKEKIGKSPVKLLKP